MLLVVLVIRNKSKISSLKVNEFACDFHRCHFFLFFSECNFT